MSAPIERYRRAGIRLWADGDTLRYDAPKGTMTPEMIADLKVHKPDILAALATPKAAAKTEGTEAHPDDIALWWRVSITEPGARTVEVDTPSGWILTDWQAYAERYHGPGCAVTRLVPLPKPRAPVNLDEALAAACEGAAGITPARFRTLLSPGDIKDIEGGGIHRKTLRAYALSFAEGIRSGRIAALPERKGAKPGPASGSIVITDAEIEAARKGGSVVRQGTFTGAQEVKP